MNHEERKIWSAQNLPTGYPIICSKELREVIQDLYKELDSETRNAARNVLRQTIISNAIQSGNNELQRRNNKFIAIVTFGGLVISFIAVCLSVVSLQSSDKWGKHQIDILDDQLIIQQQISELIKKNVLTQ